MEVRRTFDRRPPGALHDPDATLPEASDLTEPAGSFGLLLLAPAEVEHLLLEEEPHLRWRHTRLRDGAWQAVRIEP